MRAVKTIAGESERANALRRWASLYKPHGVSWNPMAKMVRAAEAQTKRSEFRLKRLLKSSDKALRRISLCEPLFADAGLNRWLNGDREEAYSDWLEWILCRLQELPGGAANVLSVLGIADPEIIAGCESSEFKIEREYYLQWGRLDLLLTIEDFLVVVIEVKKYSAETSDTAKQKGYYEWLMKQHPRLLTKAVLLVRDAAELEYENFSRLLWEHVCIRLRRLLPKIRRSAGPVKAAMFVAFISAVETNLLGLVAPKHANAVQRISYPRTIEHIEKYLRGGVV